MSRNKFPLAKILILVTILALPGFLYYLLKEKGKNRYKPLPIFGPKVVASTFHTRRGVKIPDTIYHIVKFPKMRNSGGDSVQLTTDEQLLTIVNFFYLDNKEVVPKLNEGLKNLQEQFKDNKRIRFVSIDLDPKNDDLSKLSSYKSSLGAIAKKWDILTADTSVTYPLARDQFFVNAFQTKSGDLLFSDKLILLDAENRIRGYYTGTSADEVSRISDEIKVLITEELRKIKAEF
ncbi:MAG TPA: SCO family protein [Pelobium sp.]